MDTNVCLSAEVSGMGDKEGQTLKEKGRIFFQEKEGKMGKPGF